MNFLSAQTKTADGLDATLDLPGGRDIRVKTRKGLTKTANGGLEVGIRPEHVRLGAPDDPRANLTGTVQILERLGNATIMYVETPAGQIVIQDDGDVTTATGENVGVILDPSRVHVFTSDAMAA
jgi:ABC-type sugar transport system ATPase subunit